MPTTISLDEIEHWPLDLVREQYEREQLELREWIDNDQQRTGPLTGSRKDYHDSLSRHYRLGYMRWLLNGSPKPMPRFV